MARVRAPHRHATLVTATRSLKSTKQTPKTAWSSVRMDIIKVAIIVSHAMPSAHRVMERARITA